ncbi:universal stress protein [Streptomyces meridianus]|uniref:Universal stress protein n=1 Tax=Streptomyces meridianus TaxID=2938945 RepID=A0ABT0X584_9ACTN|nr:universal stress protein [Streptomyces meridianus]MCM2576812.1 universal stress protein [Streptomyces meridianus]
MTRQPLHSAHDGVPRPGRTGLAQPVAAVLTDRVDDVAVAEAAVRMALTRRVPLLLIVAMPPRIRRASLAPTSAPVRAVLARVMPKVGPHGTGCIPEVLHLPAGRGSRLAAAEALLALATRHRAPHVVAARRGPEGLDGLALIEAAALRSGPSVHVVAPARSPRHPLSP